MDSSINGPLGLDELPRCLAPAHAATQAPTPMTTSSGSFIDHTQ